MSTRLIICALVITVLFTCGIMVLNRVLQLRQTVENERARMVTLYNGVTAENLPTDFASL